MRILARPPPSSLLRDPAEVQPEASTLEAVTPQGAAARARRPRYPRALHPGRVRPRRSPRSHSPLCVVALSVCKLETTCSVILRQFESAPAADIQLGAVKSLADHSGIGCKNFSICLLVLPHLSALQSDRTDAYHWLSDCICGSFHTGYHERDVVCKGFERAQENVGQEAMSSENSPLNADIEGLYGSDNGIGKTTNVRGKGICTWMEDNKKESLEFNSMCVSVGSNDGKFGRYLGGLVRDHNTFPLVGDHWPSVSNIAKNVLWDTIYATIEWKPEDLPRMPLIKMNIMERAKKYWRGYKYRLKNTYYVPLIGKSERWACGNKDVNTDQWREIVKYWDKEKTITIAEKNSNNRKRKKYNHTSGTKSYARSRAEYLKKHGHEPDPIQFFYDKHIRNDEQKSWIDESSKQTHADMQEKLAEIIAVEGDETLEMRERAYVTVMGPEKCQSVRGYGLGVIPDMVHYIQSDARSSNRSHRRAYARLQSQFMELSPSTNNNKNKLKCNRFKLKHNS